MASRVVYAFRVALHLYCTIRCVTVNITNIKLWRICVSEIPPLVFPGWTQMTFSEEPALAVGNSLDDSAMLSYARDLALVSNPSCSELEALARENGWSVHLLNNSQKRPHGGQVDHRSGTD